MTRDGDDPTQPASLLLHAEEVLVSRRTSQGDTVRVETVTQSRDQIVEETLRHSRVEIRRVPINRAIEAVPPVREEDGCTVIPVVEEVVVVQRRLILKEEVFVRRVDVSEEFRTVVSLREQDVAVTRQGAEQPQP